MNIYENNSLNSEQNLIGSLFVIGSKSKTLDFVFGILSKEDFFYQKNITVFGIAKDFYYSGYPIDLLTVSEKIGGDSLTEIGAVIQNTASAKNIATYAQIVKDKSKERRTMAILHDCMATLTTNDETNDKISDIVGLMSDIDVDRGIGNGGMEDMREIGKKWLDEYDIRLTSGDPIGVKTGIESLDAIFGNRGINKTDLVLIAARPKMGKEQPISSLILMSNGEFKTMGEIAVGDPLASVDGRENFVTDVYPQGEKQIYKITMKDGSSVRCGIDHLWKINSRSRFNGDRVVTTKRLIEMNECVRYKNRITFANHNGSFGKKSGCEISPWLIGFLIGDGSLVHAVSFSTSESDILSKVASLIPNDVTVKAGHGEYDYRITSPRGAQNSLLNGLRSIDLIGHKSVDKFIPEFAFSETKEFREQLLCGLIESDGWVEKNGAQMFSTSSHRLRDGFVRLTLSLGGSARYSTKKSPKYSYKGEIKTGQPSHTISFKLADLKGVITTKRISSRLKDPSRKILSTIESIEKDGVEQAQCITVSHDSHLYITDNYIVTHNTLLATTIAANISERYNKPVVIFSMEMSNVQVFERMLSTESGLNGDDFYTHLNEENYGRMHMGASRLINSKIMIDDRTGVTLQHIVSECRKIRAKYGEIGAIFVDYLTLMRKGTEERNDLAIGAITMGLKNLAKDTKTPVFLLSQLNRSLEKRDEKRPMMSDLRDSGQIEQDADRIIMIYRESVYDLECGLGGLTELGVIANRHGATGTAYADMTGGIMKSVSQDDAMHSIHMSDRRKSEKAAEEHKENGRKKKFSGFSENGT